MYEASVEPQLDQTPGGGPSLEDLTSDERRRLQAGDPAILDHFYSTYFERVYGYVRRLLREEHLAEDVTQDIFMHIHRSLPSYDPERELRPWVFTIATNKVRDFWRSRRFHDSKRESGNDGDAQNLVPTSARGPSELTEASELSQTVRAAVDQLPEGMRTTLLLRYYEGMSFSDIGLVVDRNETAVRKRYSRALEELRELLGKFQDSKNRTT